MYPAVGLSMNYMKLGQYHQFHVRNKYIDAVVEHGGLPLLIPCLNDEIRLRQYLEQIGFLIIIGGLDYPPELYGQEVHPLTELADERRVQSDFLLLRLALTMGLPLLGICAGHQLLNIYGGGKLIQHLETTDYHFGEKYHPIRWTGACRLRDILQDEAPVVNSNHHQAVDPEFVGKGFRIVAWSEDKVVEAIEFDSPQFVTGIQWHPERIMDLTHRKRIFEFISCTAANVLQHKH